ncbi:TOM1-like protein 2 [Cinnamomum micranthum f. kanehirae]|uniref:TOM1-like protein 2 n=1 Tax=Cinnamomum micranthum f. kanehirae TaxID=337451 RepID=A0A443PZ41_9MAGN|nr:TOM1-like protein 2 [Cinnamomum micranthum f. kanehirae]
MDKLKLAALGERLKTGGERLKTGGAQISRTIGDKMKEMLQGPTQESKMVDEATSNNLAEPNWGLNLRVCALLNSDELSGPEVVKAIKKKIVSNNMPSQSLSLDLLEACAMNCEKVFSAIASEKVLDEMVRMIENSQTHYANRQKAMQLIRAWGESDDLGYLPVFHQTYMSLKARGSPFSLQEDVNLEPLYSSMESGPVQQPLPLPEGYPKNSILDQQSLAYHGVPLSVEGKKEFLAVTRNCIELLSSMLNSESQNKPVKDDLTLSMLEKCKQSQPVIQRIIETTVDGENMLFEALNLHEELLKVLSKYEETEVAVQSEGEASDNVPVSVGCSSVSSIHNTIEKDDVKLNQSAGDTSGTDVASVNSG